MGLTINTYNYDFRDTKVNWVCYSCPQSKYKGKIGFTKYDGRSKIKHIIPKEE